MITGCSHAVSPRPAGDSTSAPVDTAGCGSPVTAATDAYFTEYDAVLWMGDLNYRLEDADGCDLGVNTSHARLYLPGATASSMHASQVRCCIACWMRQRSNVAIAVCRRGAVAAAIESGDMASPLTIDQLQREQAAGNVLQVCSL